MFRFLTSPAPPRDAVIGGTLIKPVRERSAGHWRAAARRAHLRGEVARALQCWLQVRHLQPRAADALFHVACCHALLDEPGRACVILYALAEHADTPEPLRRRALRLAHALEPDAVRGAAAGPAGAPAVPAGAPGTPPRASGTLAR